MLSESAAYADAASIVAFCQYLEFRNTAPDNL